MSRSRMSRRAALLAALAAVGVVGAELPASASASASTTPSLQVIAQHLKNPRKITVEWDGTILVAEAGEGQPGCAAGSTCAAPTGAIYQVQGSTQGRVVTGLPSGATISTTPGAPVQAFGPIQAFPDYFNGGFTVINGYDGNSTTRAALGPAGAKLGTIERTSDSSVVADLVDYDTKVNPYGQNPAESNPYGMVQNWDGSWTAIDAAGNDVVNVSTAGKVSTAAVLPDFTTGADSCPVSIVQGWDGTYYIADMGGMRTGGARIWKMAPGGKPVLLTSGLTDLIDLAVGNDGNLVALTLTSGFGATGPQPGGLYNVDVNTGTATEIPSGGLLHMPTGLAIGAQGQIYVSNNGATTDGQLVQFQP